MPSRIIGLPFMLLFIIFLYLTWEVSTDYSLFLIPLMIILAGIYVLSPQINWIWYKRNPPEPDARLVQLLDRFCLFYQKLVPLEKRRFRHRISLYMMGIDFIPMVFEKVPDDIKAILAANAVQITFGQEDFIMAPFEQVVVYPHPFPSPQYELIHASETYPEDGVLIFSAEQLLISFTNPTRFYNICMYEYAKVFILNHPNVPFPEPGPEIWDLLEKVGGFSQHQIEACIGLSGADPLPVCLHFFLANPERFQEVLPELYSQIREILNLDPVNGSYPVLRILD